MNSLGTCLSKLSPKQKSLIDGLVVFTADHFRENIRMICVYALPLSIISGVSLVSERVKDTKKDITRARAQFQKLSDELEGCVEKGSTTFEDIPIHQYAFWWGLKMVIMAERNSYEEISLLERGRDFIARSNPWYEEGGEEIDKNQPQIGEDVILASTFTNQCQEGVGGQYEK